MSTYICAVANIQACKAAQACVCRGHRPQRAGCRHSNTIVNYSTASCSRCAACWLRFAYRACCTMPSVGDGDERHETCAVPHFARPQHLTFNTNSPLASLKYNAMTRIESYWYPSCYEHRSPASQRAHTAVCLDIHEIIAFESIE